MARVRLPSPAMAVALLALFVALSGTGYAVSKLPKRSVGAKQLKRAAVTGPKIKRGAVSGSKIRRGAVTPSKLSKGVAALFAPKPGSIGGAQVNESSLGEVPRAARARSLDGFDPAAFAPAGAIRRFRVTLDRDSGQRPIVALGGGLSLTGRCRSYTPADPDRDIGEAFLGWSTGTLGYAQYSVDADPADTQEVPQNVSASGGFAIDKNVSNPAPTGLSTSLLHDEVLVGAKSYETTSFAAITNRGARLNGMVGVALNESVNATCTYSGVVTAG